MTPDRGSRNAIRRVLNNANYSVMTVLYNLGVTVILLQMYFFASPTITSRLRYYIVIFPVIFVVEYIRRNIDSYQKRICYMLPVYGYLFLYLYTRAGYLMGIYFFLFIYNKILTDSSFTNKKISDTSTLKFRL